MAGEHVDWPGLMRLGLGGLRLAPDVFWAMTPAELRLALEGAGLVPVRGTGPMRSERLAELMAAFPDAAPAAVGTGRGGTERGGPGAGPAGAAVGRRHDDGS